MRVAIIAALRGELKPLVRTGWRRVPAARAGVRKWVGTVGEAECVAVCGGMGAEAARRAFAEAEDGGLLNIVLSVGWAGALIEGLIPGSTHVAGSVVDAQTGERFALGGGADRVLVSTARVALENEKRRLRATYGGSFVDMESATIVRMAQMRGIPVICMKAISDDVHERLPDFNRFIDGDGQMRIARFVCHVALRPRYWSGLIRLGRASARGAETLAGAILTFLTGPRDVERVNESGNVDR